VNILITAANSAKAHQLKSKLNTANIILGDYLELPSFLLKSTGMVMLPNPDSKSYLHEMLALCLDKQICIIYPLREEEQGVLNNANQLFIEYDIKIVFDFLL